MPLTLAELLRTIEKEIAAYKIRLREIHPTYQKGDQVELAGEILQVDRYEAHPTLGPGYWLRGKSTTFVSIDLEHELCAIVH